MIHGGATRRPVMVGSTAARQTRRALRGLSQLLVLALLPVLAVAASFALAEDEPPPRTLDAAEWKALVKVLPQQLWLTEPGPRRRLRVDARWEALGSGRVVLTKKQAARVGEILRNGSPFTTQKRRDVLIDVPTGAFDDDGNEETMPVRIVVTTKYKPGCGRSFPLIVTCHGGPAGEMGMATEGRQTQMSLWKGHTSTLHCIVAAPALVGGDHGPREQQFLANVVDAADRLFNVDRDRVMLTGHSWGGILTWYLGPPNADRYALLAPFICAVNPGVDHLANLRNLPVHHVQGKRDSKWIVETGRERRDVLDELGYDHTYVEANGGHETFGTEIAKIAKAFADRRRQLYASELVRRPESRGTRGASELWYWMRTDEPSFTARADRESNTIDTDVEDWFEVLLSDELLDLDRPITVRRRGDVLWTGTVERRLDVMLAHVAETGDRARIFTAKIVID